MTPCPSCGKPTDECRLDADGVFLWHCPRCGEWTPAGRLRRRSGFPWDSVRSALRFCAEMTAQSTSSSSPLEIPSGSGSGREGSIGDAALVRRCIVGDCRRCGRVDCDGDPRQLEEPEVEAVLGWAVWDGSTRTDPRTALSARCDVPLARSDRMLTRALGLAAARLRLARLVPASSRAAHEDLEVEEEDAVLGEDPDVIRGWHDIATAMGFSPSKVREWAASAGLPVYTMPGLTRNVWARRSELQAWFREHARKVAEPGTPRHSPAEPGTPRHLTRSS